MPALPPKAAFLGRPFPLAARLTGAPKNPPTDLLRSVANDFETFKSQLGQILDNIHTAVAKGIASHGGTTYVAAPWPPSVTYSAGLSQIELTVQFMKSIEQFEKAMWAEVSTLGITAIMAAAKG